MALQEITVVGVSQFGFTAVGADGTEREYAFSRLSNNKMVDPQVQKSVLAAIQEGDVFSVEATFSQKYNKFYITDIQGAPGMDVVAAPAQTQPQPAEPPVSAPAQSDAPASAAKTQPRATTKAAFKAAPAPAETVTHAPEAPAEAQAQPAQPVQQPKVEQKVEQQHTAAPVSGGSSGVTSQSKYWEKKDERDVVKHDIDNRRACLFAAKDLVTNHKEYDDKNMPEKLMKMMGIARILEVACTTGIAAGMEEVKKILPKEPRKPSVAASNGPGIN